jgi:hypothetical protein
LLLASWIRAPRRYVPLALGLPDMGMRLGAPSKIDPAGQNL